MWVTFPTEFTFEQNPAISAMRNTSLSRNFSLSLLFVGLFVTTMTVSGCSKAEEKKPEVKKKVVTEMNIQTSGDSKSTPPANESEVESLPFENEAASEEELPILGSGG